jgi:nicotinate-nucleotide--dimethylbenzimidazole phosphoribosyltransferase
VTYERPRLPHGFDDSRARERRDAPSSWRFADDERDAVLRAIEERRDIRRFRPDPVPDDVLRRILEAGHRAPSVGLMQPWRFVIVRSDGTKAAMHLLAQRERLRQADSFDERARQFLDLKIEGIRDAPLSICVCCDRGQESDEVLGRHTIRDTDLYSTCLAIQNLWLAARAEGVGVGWVSFYREDDVQTLLALPARVVPVAWLCVGYPDERPVRPGLEAAGWGRRLELDDVIVEERWDEEPGAFEIRPGDAAAGVRVRDESDELVKPAGSLGGLESLLERWAVATGDVPPVEPQAAILVFAADHGVAAQRVSLFPGRVSAQVAGAAERGETAIGVLAKALGAELVVVDAGLGEARSADLTLGPALTAAQLDAALETGHAAALELAARSDVLLLGEIGIGNTTVAATLLAALTGLPSEAVCGRGTGLDAQGLDRKRAAVATALAANEPDPADPLECLRRVGGTDLAALVGAMFGAAQERTPVLLDGFAVGVAALVATRLQPAVRDYLFAGHRSAEPAHAAVLTELGLEPLLDLRLRLGEASGAALALPLIGLAARLHLGMRRFDEAGVERA